MGSKRELYQLYLLAEHYINTGDRSTASKRYYLATHLICERFAPPYKRFIPSPSSSALETLLKLPFIVPIVKKGDKQKIPAMQNPIMQLGILDGELRYIDGEYEVIGLRTMFELMEFDEAYMDFSSSIEGLEAETLAILSLPYSADKRLLFPTGGVVAKSNIPGGKFLLTPWEESVQASDADGIFVELSSHTNCKDLSKTIECFYARYHNFAWAIASTLCVPRERLIAPPAQLEAPRQLFSIRKVNALSFSEDSMRIAQLFAEQLPQIGHSAKIDYKRILGLLRMAESLQDSPNATLWPKFLRATSLVKGWYVDKVTKIPLLCEHNRYEKPELKYGIISDSLNVICRICGERLLGERFVVDEFAVRQLETQFGELIYNDVSTMLHAHAVKSFLDANELAIVLYTALNEFLKKENKELQKINIQKRKIYRHFVSFIAVASLVIAMTRVYPTKIISFSKKDFRNMIKKHYVEFIQELSFSLQQIEEQAERYWDESISKSFDNPEQTLKDMILHTTEESSEEAVTRALTEILSKYSSKPIENLNDFDPSALDLPAIDILWARTFFKYLRGEVGKETVVKLVKHYIRPIAYNSELFSKYTTRGRSTWLTQPKMSVDPKERRLAFEAEIKIVCPARKNEFLPHEFEASKCKFCGINDNFNVTDEYFKKYVNWIFNVWKARELLKTQSVTMREAKVHSIPIDKAVNTKIYSRFENIFGKLLMSFSPEYILDLAAIVNAIGKHSLATHLLKSSEKYKFTAINAFLLWSLENKDKQEMIADFVLFFNRN